jgi:hypothetical protein
MDAKAENAGTGPARAATGCFICETALPMMEHFLGADTVGHFRNSRIEFLKGVRSLIDERIAHLSKETEHKGTRVTVE